jgi:hypothetical protein
MNCLNCGHDALAHGSVGCDVVVGTFDNNDECKCSEFQVDHSPSEQILFDEPYFFLPKTKVPALVEEYVNKIETERTNNWCKCEWIIHPDDVDIQLDVCKKCGQHDSNGDHVLGLNELREVHEFVTPKRRMRRGAQHPQCPVHTKEGFILGFFESLFPKEVKPDD